MASAQDKAACEPGRQGAVPSASADSHPHRRSVGAGDVARFLAGGLVGLAVHESGHLATDYLFDAHPGVKRVTFGPIPFFAITHRGDLSPRREFVVASAGFWMQHLGSEVLLTRHPNLRSDGGAFGKGLLAFNVLTSVAYAGGAMAHAGPAERDTRSMAVFLGVDEGVVGAMLLAPALLDAARYFKPRNRWLVWSSRAAKVGMVLLVVRGRE